MNLQAILLAIKNLAAAFAVKPMNSIYTVAKAHIGKHLTLNNAVSPEVGCAEAWSWIMLNAGYNIPAGGIANVKGAIAWMLLHGFQEIHQAIPGAVVTAHRPDINDPDFAHIGVCGQYGIMSNSSDTGQLVEQSYPSWHAYFDPNGSITRYFEAPN